MKRMFNMTTCAEDLDRFPARAALERQMEGFDGLELLCCDEDTRALIRPQYVIGVHMCFYPYWLDFWNGDEAACLKEFGTREAMCAHFGGGSREALLARFRRDLGYAARYGAEYVVFHVADASIEESFTGCYRHSDEEVVDAACALLNRLFPMEDGPLALLLENLWQPGLTLTRPDVTQRLLDGIRYKNTGLMLDTGHLLHTKLSLKTQEEGLGYIHSVLDAQGALTERVRGVHLNQSLTGEYVKSVQASLPPLNGDYQTRALRMLEHAFRVDLHQPFVCTGVDALIARLKPSYLTFEFISENAAVQRDMLERQLVALGDRDEKYH